MIQNKILQLINGLSHPRSFQSDLTENAVKVTLEKLFPDFLVQYFYVNLFLTI